MPSPPPKGSNSSAPAAAPEGPAGEAVAQDMAKAFQEIAKGEQTATAMENKLSSLEERIDSLLEHFEAQQPSANEQSEGK